MVNTAQHKTKAIGAVLVDTSRPLKQRFRALFTLRNIGGAVAIQCIEKGFADDSALLKHELAYCLGQMQNSYAIPILIKVLEDTSQEPMVRHEAAEALGAIAGENVIPILKRFEHDAVVEVAETCQLALKRVAWLKHPESQLLMDYNPYHSVDPAPPSSKSNVEELKSILLNEEAALFERYRAMFALRNLRTSNAIRILGSALKSGSALFRHEIGFVLGQLQRVEGIPYLKESLEDSCENEMVRHECAEALGAIATPECTAILEKYLQDEKRVVRESCEIALDMSEYENSPEFQYANALQSYS